MTERTCSHPDGCPRTHFGRGFCRAHYKRWRKTGDPGPLEIRTWPSKRITCVHPDGCPRIAVAKGFCNPHWQRLVKTGEPGPVEIQERGRRDCAVDSCTEPHSSRGFCRGHYDRWRRAGDPEAPGRVGGRQRVPTAGYHAAHDRLRRDRGLASKFPCSHCDGPATQWAYDYQCPDERFDEHVGLPYSLDQRRYVPLCSSCHRRFDLTKGQRILTA